ncbi:hypothetical protein AMECASPLE_032728 [Ameca splendens]|uniref:Uncharacterized protein n=1 Tax=Ameca splendens TaxID=208324 RepID=A0ABV0XJS6_9TELE
MEIRTIQTNRLVLSLRTAKKNQVINFLQSQFGSFQILFSHIIWAELFSCLVSNSGCLISQNFKTDMVPTMVCVGVKWPYEDSSGVLHWNFLQIMKCPGQNEHCYSSCHLQHMNTFFST